MPAATAVLEKSKLAEIGDVLTLDVSMKFQPLMRSGFSAGLWARDMALLSDKEMRSAYRGARFAVIAINDPSLRGNRENKNSMLYCEGPDYHNGSRHISTLVSLKGNGGINIDGFVFEIAQSPTDGLVAASVDGLFDLVSPDFHKVSSEVTGKINSVELMAIIQQQVKTARLAANEMFSEESRPVLAGIGTLFEKMDAWNEVQYLTEKECPTASATRGEEFTNYITARLLAKAVEVDYIRPLMSRILPPATLAKPAA